MLSKIKLYLLLAAAFLLGLVGIYASGVQRGIDRARAQSDRDRLKNMQTAKEVEDEIEILDDVDLASRARGWVRRQ